MATHIYTANITIGEDFVLRGWPLRKLPLHIHLSDSFFWSSIKHKLTITDWKNIKKDKKTGLPSIKIEYIKPLTQINKEPELT